MKVLFWIAIPVLALVSCKRQEVVADKTRPVTMRDENLKLDADNDARFGAGAQPAFPSPDAAPAGDLPFKAGQVPEAWQQAPATAFRLLNYRFGAGGEVYVSKSRGGVLENLNRWLGQFGVEALDAAGLAAREKVTVAGYEGVWVDAAGDYNPGMGRPAKQAYGLRGVVAEKDGEILTVKMIGPVEQVAAQRDALEAFVGSLQAVD